jgi:hypothetical protein
MTLDVVRPSFGENMKLTEALFGVFVSLLGAYRQVRLLHPLLDHGTTASSRFLLVLDEDALQVLPWFGRLLAYTMIITKVVLVRPTIHRAGKVVPALRFLCPATVLVL